MNGNERPSRAFVAALLVLAVFAGFFELGRMDVWSDNEGQRAAPPAEMVRTGNFVIPTINGNDYLAKPPLLYWLNAGSYIITGTITPLTARIPTALCFVALVLCVFLYARREAGEMPARWAAVAVLASPYILQRSRVAEIDIPLTLAAFLTIIAFRYACESRSASRTACMTVLSGIALGAGLLLKGPPILLFLVAAWLAQMLLPADNDSWLPQGIRWTLAAFGLGTVVWLAGLLAPAAIHWIRFPIALALLAGTWLILAWRSAGRARGRLLAIFLATVATGVVVAAPWGVAVLARKGWPFVSHLLQSEMIERTHTATRINSGSPFYYAIGLLGMLAPWGLLLPLQFAKTQWQTRGPAYRFCLLSGWLSVFIFSLVAGKEYEYILPAIPFLLIALGHQLADIADETTSGWIGWYGRIWRAGMLILLTVAAVSMLVYMTLKQRHWTLLAETGGLTAVAVVLAVYGWKNRPRRLMALAGTALCAMLILLLSQSYYYTGQRSWRTIAETMGKMLRAGYNVEAVKMTAAFDIFPGFAFHCGTVIPTTADASQVRKKITGEPPYYCVIRADLLSSTQETIPPELSKPLLGPYTRKKLILIGNRPLPTLPD